MLALFLTAVLLAPISAAPIRILPPEEIPLPGYAKSIDNFPVLIDNLHSPDKAMRLMTVNALGVFGEFRSVPYLGAVLLQLNEDADVRAAAAAALGRIRDWRARPFLRQALRDRSQDVRFASALALELISARLKKDPPAAPGSGSRP